MIFVKTPRAEKSIHEKNLGGVFYIEKFFEKIYMLKADFCRLALGTFFITHRDTPRYQRTPKYCPY